MSLSRMRQLDLGPLASSMGTAAQIAIVRIWKRTGRPVQDLHEAAVMAAALLAQVAREGGDLPLSTWADANRAAQDPTSILHQSPEIPGITHG